MKLVISKSRDGKGYYSKIQNDFNGVHIEKYLSVQVPKEFDLNYGLYEVDGFLSVYNKKNGTSEFKFVLISADLIKEFEKVENAQKNENTVQNPYEEFANSMTTEFDTGEQIQIKNSDLPF